MHNPEGELVKKLQALSPGVGGPLPGHKMTLAERAAKIAELYTINVTPVTDQLQYPQYSIRWLSWKGWKEPSTRSVPSKPTWVFESALRQNIISCFNFFINKHHNVPFWHFSLTNKHHNVPFWHFSLTDSPKEIYSSWQSAKRFTGWWYRNAKMISSPKINHSLLPTSMCY